MLSLEILGRICIQMFLCHRNGSDAIFGNPESMPDLFFFFLLRNSNLKI